MKFCKIYLIVLFCHSYVVDFHFQADIFHIKKQKQNKEWYVHVQYFFASQEFTNTDSIL